MLQEKIRIKKSEGLLTKSNYRGEIMQIVLISGKKDVGDMMQCFDVFEKSKVLAWPEVFEVDVKSENAGNSGKIVEKFRQVIEESDDYNVVACFSPGLAEGAFVKENVISISNGKSWAVLDKVLEAYGYLAGE